jgi:hypothetical protein
MTPASNPWDTWALDEEFFAALSCWTIANPETGIDRVLEKVCIAIEANRDFIECIPDSPFPARSLVKALCQLLKVGTVRFQVDVYGDAKLNGSVVNIEGQNRRPGIRERNCTLDQPSSFRV